MDEHAWSVQKGVLGMDVVTRSMWDMYCAHAILPRIYGVRGVFCVAI